MDTKEYSRLLIRLLLLPLLALSLLAIGLGYSLHRVENSAAWVDHSDQVIAHANRIIELIVDEETGMRGYFLGHDSSFLEPYNRAERLLPQEFDTTLLMVQDNPNQTARLQQLEQSYNQWKTVARKDLTAPEANTTAADMLGRKREMDQTRAQATQFLQAEETLRQHRSMISSRINVRARTGLIFILILVGLAIAWATLRTFSQLRKMFQAQLQHVSEQRDLADSGKQWLNTTLRSIGDGVIACDPAGYVALMNPVAKQITGWVEQDAKGHALPDIFNIVNEYTRAIVENPVEKVRRTGTVVGLANHTVLIRKDGSECGIDDSASPIRGTDGRMIGIVLVFHDCSERRSSEVALMRAEKLAAAGKLAASIAHEVNNPLEGLTNMLYLVDQSKDLAEVHEWLTQAQSEVARLSHITRRTLGFYRENTRPIIYRPADVMEEVLSFYVPEALSKKVQLESRIRTRQQIYGIPGELRQVFGNLIANSLDAMPGGGVIRLVVREVTDLKDPTKKGVRITVADTGRGIPAHILMHIFEPFFTTKVDTGTGLGLWVSKELIEKQGGSLRVRSSASGRQTGTAFSIYIPVHSVRAGVVEELLHDAVEEAQI